MHVGNGCVHHHRLPVMKITEPGEILGASAAILGKPYEVTAEIMEPSQGNFV